MGNFSVNNNPNMNIVMIYLTSCCFKPVWLNLFCKTHKKKIFWRTLV